MNSSSVSALEGVSPNSSNLFLKVDSCTLTIRTTSDGVLEKSCRRAAMSSAGNYVIFLMIRLILALTTFLQTSILSLSVVWILHSKYPLRDSLKVAVGRISYTLVSYLLHKSPMAVDLNVWSLSSSSAPIAALSCSRHAVSHRTATAMRTVICIDKDLQENT